MRFKRASMFSGFLRTPASNSSALGRERFLPEYSSRMARTESGNMPKAPSAPDRFVEGGGDSGRGPLCAEAFEAKAQNRLTSKRCRPVRNIKRLMRIVR